MPDMILVGAATASDKWQELVEMGESRTPRPEPFGRDHYERVRSFSSTVGARIGTLTVGPVTCL
jgi:hypothetical protein